MIVRTLIEFHSTASLHARTAAFAELSLWQQPEPNSTSATRFMPLLVDGTVMPSERPRVESMAARHGQRRRDDLVVEVEGVKTRGV